MKAKLSDRVFRTLLEEEKKTVLAGSLVIKFAKFEDQRKSLRAEYHSHTALHGGSGAVEYLGLFSHHSINDYFLILIMTNGGESLKAQVRKVTQATRFVYPIYLPILDGTDKTVFLERSFLIYSTLSTVEALSMEQSIRNIYSSMNLERLA